MLTEISHFNADAYQAALEAIIKGQPLPVTINDLRKTYSDATIDAVVSAAYSFIAKESDPDLDLEKGKALLRLDMLFLRDLGIKDYKAALACQVERNKLLRLYAPKKGRGPANARQVDPIAATLDEIIDAHES